MNNRDIKIGEAVEVKSARYDPSRGRPATIEWIPATVAWVTDWQIGVVFADHTRMAVERGRHKFRRASYE